MSHEHERIAQLLSRRRQFLLFLRSCGVQAAADDILQAAYVRVLERGVSLRDEEKAVSWFYSVLRNAAVDHLRASRRRHRLHEQAACKRKAEGDARDDDPRLARTMAMIEALEPRYRDVLDSVYVRGLSMSEVATKLGITRNAATARVHRARRALGALVKRTEDREIAVAPEPSRSRVARPTSPSTAAP